MLRFLGQFQADFLLTNGWIEPLLVGGYAPFSPCQGRIYQNKGDDDMAMQCFILGKEHCKGISDTLTLANLMVAQASIQYSIYKYKQQS